jgi:hypothetical protein
MSQRQRVLVTGACGDIASQVLPELRERHAVTLIDVSITDRAGRPVEGVIQADLAASDASSYERHFVGVDVVLHLGYQRPPGTASPMERFEIELTNVRMAQNVYHCAYESGVRRVVVGSSNHAADWYEHALIHAGKSDVVRPTDLPLSDNFYGWAKASYELLGFVYASGTLGRKLEVVQLRIGAARDVAGRHYEDGPMVQGGMTWWRDSCAAAARTSGRAGDVRPRGGADARSEGRERGADRRLRPRVRRSVGSGSLTARWSARGAASRRADAVASCARRRRSPRRADPTLDPDRYCSES